MKRTEYDGIYRLLEDKNFRHETSSGVRRGMIETWIEELGTRIVSAEEKMWGKVWTIHNDSIPDMENAFCPTLSNLARKDILDRRQVRVILLEGPMEMRYFHNRHRSFCVVTEAAALYTPRLDGINAVKAPEIYSQGQNVYVFQDERYAWTPIIGGKNGYGLPIPAVLVEIEMVRRGIQPEETDEVITIDLYKK